MLVHETCGLAFNCVQRPDEHLLELLMCAVLVLRHEQNVAMSKIKKLMCVQVVDVVTSVEEPPVEVVPSDAFGDDCDDSDDTSVGRSPYFSNSHIISGMI